VTVRRRDLLATLGAASAGLAGCLRLDGAVLGGGCPSYEPVRPSDADWTSRMGNPAGTAAVAPDAAPGTDLTLDWAVPIETSVGYPVPAVADGTVYVHDMDTTLFALDAGSGDERWRAAVADPLWTPALGDGTVVVRTRSEVEAFDAGTGDRRWGALGGLEEWTDARPVVADGAVFVMADVAAYAFDLAAGDRRWRFPTGLRSESTPAVADGTVYVAGDEAYVRALATADGSERWRAKTDARVRCNLSVADGLVCAATEAGDVLGFDADGGTEQWRHRLPDARNSDRPGRPRTVNTDGARVYVTTRDRLYALDAATGSRCWRTTEYQGGYASGVAVADGAVYAPTEHPDDPFTSYDAATGDVRRRVRPAEDPYFSVGPSLAEGALYAAGDGAVGRYR
jgi:outer membrane protein assembly factor BamB